MGGLVFDENEVRDLCEAFGIAQFELFGSAARGELREGSDVDLLYTVAEGRSLGWEIAELEEQLSLTFGRPVDLVARTALHPLIRDKVLREAVPLHATV